MQCKMAFKHVIHTIILLCIDYLKCFNLFDRFIENFGLWIKWIQAVEWRCCGLPTKITILLYMTQLYLATRCMDLSVCLLSFKATHVCLLHIQSVCLACWSCVLNFHVADTMSDRPMTSCVAILLLINKIPFNICVVDTVPLLICSLMIIALHSYVNLKWCVKLLHGITQT